MRTFVAVFPPPEVRHAALVAAQRAILPADMVRWTHPDNIHLTLKFLGEVPEEMIEQIGAALQRACVNHTPFDANLSRFGAFPSMRRARIVWAGTGAGSERLRTLAADVEAILEPLGFGREGRTFVPHATLGRLGARPVKLPTVVPGEPRFGVSRVELMESTLTAGGSVYKPLQSLALRSG